MTSPAPAPIAIDVTDATFGEEVIQRSMTIPVIVDFWAPWCGPCRVLGPTLERVAAEYRGKVILAKLDTDENPQAATAFKIQGIPAVKAFKQGQVVMEFTGALPEVQVRRFFRRLAPTPADVLVIRGDEQFEAGLADAAEHSYREALKLDATHGEGIIGLASLLLANGKRAEAEQLLDRAPANSREVKAMRHLIWFGDFEDGHHGQDLETPARENPTDASALYRWGMTLAANERYQEALDVFLESVRLDRKAEDEGARKGLIAIFDIVGTDHPIIREYQKKLTALLF